MERRDMRNAALNVVGESFWGFQAHLVYAATVLTVLLREFGAGNLMVGSVGAIESGLMVLPQILGIFIFATPKTRKVRLVIWHFLMVIPFLFLQGWLLLNSSQLDARLVRWGLLFSFSGYMFGIGVLISAWLDWLAHLFHKGIRGTVMGVAFGAYSLCGAGAAFLASWWIKSAGTENMTAYSGLYFAAGTIAIVGISCFMLIDDPVATDTVAPPPPRLVDIIRRFRESLADRMFRRYLFGRALAAAGFCMIPFIALYYRSSAGGELAEYVIIGCCAAMTGGTTAGNLIFGWLGDKFGHRIGIIGGVLAQMCALLILLTTAGWWSCVAAYFFAGVVISGGFISHSNILFESCLHDHRMAHITVGNLVLSVPLVIAPFVAGSVAEVWGLRVVFGGCLAISIGAIIWFLLWVKDPRKYARSITAAE